MTQEYRPEAMERTDAPLPEELRGLVEDMAASVHDAWAAQRIRTGWTYGPSRDDGKKQTPLLVPYEQLPEEEKIYDRSTALQTIRFLLSRGYAFRHLPRETQPVPGRKENGTVIRFHMPENENGYLSSRYPCGFALEGKHYCCPEQYLLEQKALLSGDPQTAGRILSAKDCRELRAFAEAADAADSGTWAGIRQIAAYRANLAKFRQNPELTEKLLATGDALLAECSEWDMVWGIGLGPENAAAEDPGQWRGQNLLGFTLMAVRDALRRDFPIE
ncbi:MAG: NADAR domain-containing protein [Oscillospiraceae bacterium]